MGLPEASSQLSLRFPYLKGVVSGHYRAWWMFLPLDASLREPLFFTLS